MLMTEIIRIKRDGGRLDEAALAAFVDGLADGSLPAEQVAALAMAIFLNGMKPEEAGALTRLMARSGTVLEWDREALGGPVVDKHSTGGIGDKVSFPLAAIAAACGCFVPMISGRGLGHTGGTLDKLDSIPGYDTTPGLDRFRTVVKEVGCAIIGQTADLAPADRRFYAVRDVTATVESIPLITASILSKKIAAGNEALVMDVKTGSGAFMQSLGDSEALAASILRVAAEAGLRTHALITDMNEPLGTTVGNALEIAESIAYLTGAACEPHLDAVVIGLAAEMLLLGGVEADRKRAGEMAREVLESGRAAEVFGRMVAALGGPASLVEDPARHLPRAPVQRPVHATEAGYLERVDARSIGHALIELGGGRQRIDDRLDLSVGFSDIVPIGTHVDGRTPLAIVHAATEQAAGRAAAAYNAAVAIADQPPKPRPIVYKIMTGH